MADKNYEIPETPEYSEEIRKLQDSDPASASGVFNPLFRRIIENVAAVKRLVDSGGVQTEEDISALQTAATALQESITTLQGSVTSISSELISVKQQVNEGGAETEGNINDLQTAAQALQESVTALSTELASVKQKANNAVPNTRKVNNKALGADISLTAEDVGASPTGHKHTKSEITDFPTSMPASDVSAWAKAAQKPSYTASEVGARPSSWTPSASDVGGIPKSGGAMTGTLSNANSAQVRNIQAGTTDLTAGTSTLATGSLYLVYE